VCRVYTSRDIDDPKAHKNNFKKNIFLRHWYLGLCTSNTRPEIFTLVSKIMSAVQWHLVFTEGGQEKSRKVRFTRMFQLKCIAAHQNAAAGKEAWEVYSSRTSQWSSVKEISLVITVVRFPRPLIMSWWGQPAQYKDSLYSSVHTVEPQLYYLWWNPSILQLPLN